MCGFIQSNQQLKTPSQTNTQWHAQWHPHKKSTRSTTALRELYHSEFHNRSLLVFYMHVNGRAGGRGVMCPCHARSPTELMQYSSVCVHFLTCGYLHALVVITKLHYVPLQNCVPRPKKRPHLQWSCGNICDHTAPIIGAAHIILMSSQQGSESQELRFGSKTTSLYKKLHIYHVTHRYFFLITIN